MPSRRIFIQRAGILAGVSVLPSFTKPLVAGRTSSLAEDTRNQLLVPVGKIYLNTGSLGPSPRAVVDAVTSAMHKLESDPASENWGKLGDQIDIVRQKVADFIHADLEEIILTRNTTEGLGLISQSLPLNAGDEIITTTLEHGGGEVGLEFLQKTKGAVLKKVALPLPPERATEIVSVIEKAITPKTRLVMVSHVNTVTGVLMPLAEISRLTSVRGIYLVADGAQAPGQVPVDVKALGVDAYACSGHKWLLGPKETGFLYLRRGFQPSAQPVFTASGYEGYSKSSGTRNVATIIGLGAALDWLSAIGMDRIREHSLKVRTHCMAGLKSVKGIEVISPENPSLATGMVSFSLANVKNSTVHSLLKDQNIIIKVLPQHNAIRISCHVFVSEKDIDTFLTALKKCVA